jgi:hypothetical protein
MGLNNLLLRGFARGLVRGWPHAPETTKAWTNERVSKMYEDGDLVVNQFWQVVIQRAISPV